MAERHRIEPGECLSSVAVEHGFRWETLWEHPENAALRETRQSPYVLLPGDEVFIPAKRERELPCATAKRHVFRRRGVPEQLRVRLCHEDVPRAPHGHAALGWANNAPLAGQIVRRCPNCGPLTFEAG